MSLSASRGDGAASHLEQTAGKRTIFKLLGVPNEGNIDGPSYMPGKSSGFQQQQNRPLIYGHYPASHHNLKQLKRRYSTAAVVIPVRPLGALLCSLIHHTRRKSYGPLDLRCPGMIDGIPDLHERSESDLFYLLGILYLPQIYLLIRSWVETTKAKNIQLIFAPFKSITEA